MDGVQHIMEGHRPQGMPRAKVPSIAHPERSYSASSQEGSQPAAEYSGSGKWTLLHQANSPAELLKFVRGLREECDLYSKHSYRTSAGSIQVLACRVRECGYRVRMLRSSLSVETMGEHCHPRSAPTVRARGQKRKANLPSKGWMSSADRLRGARLDRLVRHCKDVLGLVPLTETKASNLSNAPNQHSNKLPQLSDVLPQDSAVSPQELSVSPQEFEVSLKESNDLCQQSTVSRQQINGSREDPSASLHKCNVLRQVSEPPLPNCLVEPSISRRVTKGKATRKPKSDDSSKLLVFEEKLDLLIGMLAAKTELSQSIESKLYDKGTKADLNALEQHFQEIGYVCYLIKCAVKRLVALPPPSGEVNETDDCSFCHRSTDGQPFAACANENCQRSFHLKCVDFNSASSSGNRIWRCAQCSALFRCLQKVNEAIGASCETFEEIVAAIAAEDFVWEDWVPSSVFDPEKAVESMIRGKNFRIASRVRQLEEGCQGPEHWVDSGEGPARSQWEVFEHRVWSLLQDLLREMHFYGTYTHRRRDHEHELIDARELSAYRRRISLKQGEIQGVFHEILAVHAGDRKFPQLGIEDENGEVDLEGVHCSRCGNSDEPGNDILVCDREGCCRAFHQNCLAPPIDAAVAESESHWFCWECDTVNECLAWINEACGTSFRGVGDLFVEEDEMDRQLRLEGYREEEDEDYHPEVEVWKSSEESDASSSDSDSDYASEDFLGSNDREDGSQSSSLNESTMSVASAEEGRSLRRSTLMRHVGSIEHAESDSSYSDEDFNSDASSLCDYTDYRDILRNDEGFGARGVGDGEGSGETGRASDTDFDSEGGSGSDSSQSTDEYSEEHPPLTSQRSSRSRGGDVVKGISFDDDYSEADSESDELGTDSVQNTSSSSASSQTKHKPIPSSLPKRKEHVGDGEAPLPRMKDPKYGSKCELPPNSGDDPQLAQKERISKFKRPLYLEDEEEEFESDKQSRSAHHSNVLRSTARGGNITVAVEDAEIEVIKFRREVLTVDLTQDSD